MKIISHRGANREKPENTLAAFRRAVEIGVDVLEADVLLTKDGLPVIRHDDLIQKGQNYYYINELTSWELSAVDLGGGHHIPSLDEFLAEFSGNIPIMLDLKCLGCVRAIEPQLRKIENYDCIHVTSFLHPEILLMSELFPEIKRSIVLSAIPIKFEDLFRQTCSTEVSLFRGYLDEGNVKKLKAHGILVRSYPVNLLREAQKFADWGLDAIFTDVPDVMISLRS